MVEGPKVKLKRERLLNQLYDHLLNKKKQPSTQHHHHSTHSCDFSLTSISLSSTLSFASSPPRFENFKHANDDSLGKVTTSWLLLCIIVMGKELLLCFISSDSALQALLTDNTTFIEDDSADAYHEQRHWSLLEAVYNHIVASQQQKDKPSSSDNTVELFLIKIHFGMSGSERLVFTPASSSTTSTTSTTSSMQASPLSKSPQEHENFAKSALLPQHSRKRLSAVVEMSSVSENGSVNHISLYLFDSTITIIDKPLQKIKSLLTLRQYDVMNMTYCNFLSIQQKILQQHKDTTRAIQETILDQEILPGVGNVIKCEALYRCSIPPEFPSHLLTNEQCLQLIQALQDFSWDWYHATKRGGKDVLKQVYGRSQCLTCQSAISLVRFTGNSSYQRITYFCPTCQPLTAVNSSQSTMSKHIQLESSVSRKRSLTENMDDSINVVRWNCQFCNFDNTVDVTTTTTGSGSSNSSSSKTNIGYNQQHDRPGCSICGELIPLELFKNEQPKHHRVVDNNTNQTITNVGSSSTNSNNNTQSSITMGVSTLQALKCQCGKAASLQRVRNSSSPNLHRLFWSCSSTRGKKAGCSFFQWADGMFPKCPQQQTSVPSHFTILRRVLKEGSNNGRYFYTCSCKGCEFFQWDCGVPPSSIYKNGMTLHQWTYYQGSIPL